MANQYLLFAKSDKHDYNVTKLFNFNQNFNVNIG